MDADGLSLDDKRTELLPPEKLGPVPKAALTLENHAKNNLPDILTRWRSLKSEFSNVKSPERSRKRTAQSFLIPKADIAAQGYDLSLNRYKEVVHEEVTHRAPGEILQSLAALEKEITTGMKELENMLK